MQALSAASSQACWSYPADRAASTGLKELRTRVPYYYPAVVRLIAPCRIGRRVPHASSWLAVVAGAPLKEKKSFLPAASGAHIFLTMPRLP